MKSPIVVLLMLAVLPVSAFDLATRITKTGTTTQVETSSYAKLVLLREKTSLSGAIVASGRLSVTGSASVVMWTKVDGRYYFSRLPVLQNVQDRDGLDFAIPFDAGEQTITEVLIEVELHAATSLVIEDLELRPR